MKQEKSLIKQNILHYLHLKGVSEYQFYKESGVTRGVLKQLNGISEENMARFLDYAPDVNTEWLLTGRGDVIKSNFVLNKEEDTNSQSSSTVQSSHQGSIQSNHSYEDIFSKSRTPNSIPLVSVKAVGGFAGTDFLINENDIEGYYVIPKFRNLNVDFLIEISGDSMMPRFYPGDIIACSIVHNSRFIQWNKPYLIATREDGMIVKRIKPSAEQDSILAVSDNAEFYPFDIPKSDID